MYFIYNACLVCFKILERQIDEKAQETEDIELKIQQIRDLESLYSADSKSQISLKKLHEEYYLNFLSIAYISLFQ